MSTSMEDVAVGLESQRRLAWSKFYEAQREMEFLRSQCDRYMKDAQSEYDARVRLEREMLDLRMMCAQLATALWFERKHPGDSVVRLSEVLPPRGFTEKFDRHKWPRVEMRRLWRAAVAGIRGDQALMEAWLKLPQPRPSSRSTRRKS